MPKSWQVELPLSADKAKMPASLKYVMVGKETAKEINWIPSEQ